MNGVRACLCLAMESAIPGRSLTPALQEYSYKYQNDIAALTAPEEKLKNQTLINFLER